MHKRARGRAERGLWCHNVSGNAFVGFNEWIEVAARSDTRPNGFGHAISEILLDRLER